MRGMVGGDLLSGFDLGDTARASMRPLLDLAARYAAKRREREPGAVTGRSDVPGRLTDRLTPEHGTEIQATVATGFNPRCRREA
jgi:hypothetical protein